MSEAQKKKTPDYANEARNGGFLTWYAFTPVLAILILNGVFMASLDDSVGSFIV